MAFSQFQTALSSALNFALTAVNVEQKFTWLFGAFAVTAWVIGTIFMIRCVSPCPLTIARIDNPFYQASDNWTAWKSNSMPSVQASATASRKRNTKLIINSRSCYILGQSCHLLSSYSRLVLATSIHAHIIIVSLIVYNNIQLKHPFVGQGRVRYTHKRRKRIINREGEVSINLSTRQNHCCR